MFTVVKMDFFNFLPLVSIFIGFYCRVFFVLGLSSEPTNPHITSYFAAFRTFHEKVRGIINIA